MFLEFYLVAECQAFLKELDQKLWSLFKTAFETLAANKLNALYAKGGFPVAVNGMTAENRFKAAKPRQSGKNKASTSGIRSEFWCDSRKANTITCYGVGSNRIHPTNSDGANSIYSQFRSVLQKVNGTGKIAQNRDTFTCYGKRIPAQVLDRQKTQEFQYVISCRIL